MAEQRLKVRLELRHILIRLSLRQQHTLLSDAPPVMARYPKAILMTGLFHHELHAEIATVPFTKNIQKAFMPQKPDAITAIIHMKSGCRCLCPVTTSTGNAPSAMTPEKPFKSTPNGYLKQICISIRCHALPAIPVQKIMS